MYGKCSLFVVVLLLALCGAGTACAEDGVVAGVVKDAQGAVVPDASLALLDANQAIVGAGRSDAQGRFRFVVPHGRYVLRIHSPGFAESTLALDVRAGVLRELEVQLQLQSVRQYVTVTAHAGLVEDVDAVPQAVNVIPEEFIQQRAKSGVAQIAQEETGVALQRTSPTMAGIYVRGLVGDKVNVFVDGFRFSNAAARGGVNTFLDLIDASTLQAVEIVRGPSSAQYGSDAMGGTVQFISRTPEFSSDKSHLHGQFSAFFDAADASFGSASSVSYARKNFGLLASATGRRHNRLRTGGGFDSHAAVTRFLGLPSGVLDDGRMPGTAFTQYGGLVRMNWAPRPGSQFILYYARSQQDGARRYDQLLGGDGNLVADLGNLMLDFFYLRYERLKWGWFDSFTAGYSFNSQREERVNQGGNGNPLAVITHEYERTRAQGVNAHAGKQWGARNNFLFGGDFYGETIRAPSFQFNPASGTTALRRGRVPDGARYFSGGFFVQEVFDAIANRLRLTGNIRYNGAHYRARSADSPAAGGQPFWPDDALTVHGVTFRAGVVASLSKKFSLTAKAGRGYRAPLLTDLGTLGLTGSGFEVAAADLAGLGATVGSRADSDAVSTGAPVQQLRPEASLTWEVGAHFRTAHFDTDLNFFVNDLSEVIVKQALVLPAGAVGTLLGGTPVTAQNAHGVVFVAASSSPVLVRANFDRARIRGIEHRLNWKVSRDWSVGTTWTWLHAEDPRTGLPPNIEGGLPAPDAYVKLRYAPQRSRFWMEPYVHGASKQSRLSSLDLADRRTGAERTRDSIRNFFHGGATVRGLVGAGPDSVLGTTDDILLATGETLAQVQDRVLGAGVNSAPLFLKVPGYFTLGIRGGASWKERHQLLLDLENLTDRNYRGISWGLDAPGRALSARYTYRF
jgi:hemoglobin/transferrin/lactoferrin receptor protein